MGAPCRRADHAHPLLVQFFGIELNRIGDDDETAVLADERVESQGSDAPRSDESHIPVVDAVGLHGGFDRRR